MSFPQCRHGEQSVRKPAARLAWLAEEPFRVFFIAGALWSAVGVLLWLLFYGGWLRMYPGLMHARLMIEGFGGAFVVGFLGTAGPRMASAPKLSRLELLLLAAMHTGAMLCHVRMWHGWGDQLFALLLVGLLVTLMVRVIRHRREWPPPQMLLALTGLGCGIAGAAMLGWPRLVATPEQMRLAGLLLYQGLLLAPTLGIGTFLFPRMLGGGFGTAGSAKEARWKGVRAAVAAVLLVVSFGVEAFGSASLGQLLRVLVAGGYLTWEVKWLSSQADGQARGTLVKGLFWALVAGGLGMVLAAVFPSQRVSAEHLLYAGGFGLLMLVVGSRVLFGHSGELAGFSQRSWSARLLVFLPLLAAATRVTTGFLPQLTVTHHVYAALTWLGAVVLWLMWHGRRFAKRDAG